MSKFGDILIGLGYAAGGAAQGLQAGMAINQRQQMIELEKRQSNLQAIGAFADIMEPGVDPVIREMTMKQLIPQLGFSEQKGTEFIKNANRLDDENKAALSNFLKNHPAVASGKFPLGMLLEQAADDPQGTMKFIQDFEITEKAEERAQAGDIRDEKRLTLDERATDANIIQGQEQIKISRGNLAINQQQLKLQAAAQASAQINAVITHQREGMKAVEGVLKIKDDNARGIMLDKLNTTYGLFDDTQMTSLKEAPMETSDDILADLNVKLKKLELTDRQLRGELTTAETKGQLALRAEGKTTPNMKPDMVNTSPEDAKTMLKAMSSSTVTTQKGLTKSDTSKTNLQIGEIDFTISMTNDLIGMIEKNPEIAGASGTVGRGAQAAVGALKSLGNLARSEGPAMLESLRANNQIDADVASEIEGLLNNPDVQNAAVVEAVLRLSFAKQITTGGRINREQYEVAAGQVNITGIKDAEQVITKLRKVLFTMKGKRGILQKQLNAGMVDQDIGEDTQDEPDEETNQGVLDYLMGGEEE